MKKLVVLGLLLLTLQLACDGKRIAPYPFITHDNSWTFDTALKNFAVMAPSQYRPGRAYTVAVNAISSPASSMRLLASAHASLVCTPSRVGYEAFTLTGEWSAGPTDRLNSVLLTLEMTETPKRLDSTSQCKLTVRLVNSAGQQFADTGDVSVDAVQTEIFVQTDKAIYRPGQAVKFRVVSVSEALMPVFENFTVFVKDAEGNLVDRFEHSPKPSDTADVASALFSGQFQLSDQPNLGDWSLVVESASGKETKVFTVDRYVLPKLEVRLELPDFVHLNTTEFSVIAEPRYTYDKTADGDLAVNVSLSYRCMDTRSVHGFASIDCSFNLTGRSRAAPASGKSAGPVEFKFNLDEWRHYMAKRGITMYRWSQVTATAVGEFVEKFSGVKTRANKTFTVYKKIYDLEIDTSQVDFVLPGMTLPVKVKLVRADGKPYLGELPPGDITMSMSWDVHGVATSARVFSIAPDGSQGSWSVPVVVPDDSDFTGVRFEATCPGLSRKVYASVQSFQTRGSSALRIDINSVATAAGGDATASVDKDLQILVHLGNGMAADFVYCAIVSQEGVLTHWLKLTPPSSSTDDSSAATATVTLSAARVAALHPKFNILAVGFHGNELVATTKVYQPPGAYDGVRLSSNLTAKAAASPRQPVRVSVSASPNAVVFLTGIDHSVNLMKSGQDIDAGAIEQRVASAKTGGLRNRWWRPRPNTESELKKCGLLALTDFNYMKEEPMIMYSLRARVGMVDDPVMEAAADPAMSLRQIHNRPTAPVGGNNNNKKNAGTDKPVQVRKFFPESFIWTWLKTNASGSAHHTVTLPDTITSWDVTGFALSSAKPLQGARSPLNIVSRQAFFIRPVLPYALIRGEKFLLKVLLFNYATEAAKATVQLAPDRSFRLLDSDSGYSRKAGVPAGGSNVVVFAIQAVQLPEMKLALRADAEGVSDAVERVVRVEPEGAVRRRVATALLNLTAAGSATATVTQRLAVDFPDKLAWIEGGKKQLVEGSEYARIQVTGTVMGASVSNLERLLRMPYGCGEQNMINFAPAVFVLDCLGPAEASPDVVAKAVGIMKTGYQRELTYRRKDGSYSAFGDSDASGSTWLTAFVLSIYAQAAAFIPMDPEALSGPSLDYLLAQQQPDGSFASTGRVIHADMQGAGASGKAGLTAYVCASLLRVVRACRNQPQLQSSRWRAAPDSALAAMRRGLRFVYNDYRFRPANFRPADLAVAAYAARLAVDLDSDASAADAANDVKVASFLWMQLYESSRSEGDTKRYWGSGASSGAGGSAETTGYALLTAMLRNDLEASLPALRWLVSRQSDLGGFQSTQDTVVGLQAMARFAKAHPGGYGLGSVRVSWTSAGQSTAVFGLGPKNRTLLQRREIGRGDSARALASGVSVSGTGSGVAMVTVAYAYNVRDAPHGWISTEWTLLADDAGGLGLRLHSVGNVLGGYAPEGSTAEVTICAKANDGPGMYIVTLTNPSGFGVDAHSPVGGTIARVEPEADRLVFYLTELTEEICLSARWVREVPVLELNPQRFTVQNYYKPDREISLFHMHPKLTGLTECQVCPDCPKCTGSGTDREL